MVATAKRPVTPKHVRAKFKHKEVWLNEALDQFIRPHFKEAGYTAPKHVRISTGWPSRGAFGKKSRRIGEAWTNKCSDDGAHEIIISLYLDDPIKVLGVLIHEVVHVTVGVEHGHKKPFVDCMKAVGLCGKPTATDETPELMATIKGWLKTLGQYPHAKLDGKNQKKQSTRLLKLECRGCGCKVRVTQKWIEEYGSKWPCPCGFELEAD